MGHQGPSFDEAQLRGAIADSKSFSEALRRLGLRAAGGNHKTLAKYARRWEISTAHFDPDAWRQGASGGRALADILIEGSSYSNRGALKERLYDSGLKERRCELCGQGEIWRGRPMSLILDHRNGVHDDHRLENLQIVCANCNATLPTHCGRKLRKERAARACPHCGESFVPKDGRQRYCSRPCGRRWDRRGRGSTAQRRAERPPYAELCARIDAEGYEAVGRSFGLSGNAIRKWKRRYELESPAGTPGPGSSSTMPG